MAWEKSVTYMRRFTCSKAEYCALRKQDEENATGNDGNYSRDEKQRWREHTGRPKCCKIGTSTYCGKGFDRIRALNVTLWDSNYLNYITT